MTDQEYAEWLYDHLTADDISMWMENHRKYACVLAKTGPLDPEDFREDAADDVDFWRACARADEADRYEDDWPLQYML